MPAVVEITAKTVFVSSLISWVLKQLWLFLSIRYFLNLDQS